MVGAMLEVTTGLLESNGSLPPGGWFKVTCGQTACTPGSAMGPMHHEKIAYDLQKLPEYLSKFPEFYEFSKIKKFPEISRVVSTLY